MLPCLSDQQIQKLASSVLRIRAMLKCAVARVPRWIQAARAKRNHGYSRTAEITDHGETGGAGHALSQHNRNGHAGIHSRRYKSSTVKRI